MHRTPRVSWALASILLLSGGGSGAQSLPAPDRNFTQAARCELDDLRGSYGFFRTGVNAQGAIAAVGIGQFDGQGNVTTTQSTSRNGTVTQGSFPGSYDVAADCRGARYDASGAVIAHFVILDSGKEFYFLSTFPGNTITGHGKRIAGS